MSNSVEKTIRTLLEARLKHTHEATLVKKQHGYWGSTELSSKLIKLAAVDDEHAKSLAEFHAANLPRKRLKNGDMTSWSVQSCCAVTPTIDTADTPIGLGQ